MKFKTVNNEEYIVDVQLTSTFNDITLLLQEVMGEENLNISFMARGKIINLEHTVDQEGLDNNSTVIIVIRKQQHLNSVEQSDPTPSTITLNIDGGELYEKIDVLKNTKHEGTM